LGFSDVVFSSIGAEHRGGQCLPFSLVYRLLSNLRTNLRMETQKSGSNSGKVSMKLAHVLLEVVSSPKKMGFYPHKAVFRQ
jgi:hypothetical protein